MRQLLLSTALLSMAFVTCGTVAQAQPRWWGAWPPERVSGLVHRVHDDLNRGYHSGWRFNGHDRGRLDHAEGRLNEFAESGTIRGGSICTIWITPSATFSTSLTTTT